MQERERASCRSSPAIDVKTKHSKSHIEKETMIVIGSLYINQFFK